MPMAVVYIKVIGAICVISGCGGIGWSVSHSYVSRYRQLGSVRRMIMFLKGEIRYAGSELPEAFEHVAGRMAPPFSTFLLHLSEEMRTMDGRLFDVLWKQNIESGLADTSLTKEDKEALFRLGGQLGFLDREMQLAAVDLYLNELDASMQVIEQVMPQKQKLSLSLGILSGFFLSVLLV